VLGVMRFGVLPSRADRRDLVLRRRDAVRRLFLEDVQDVDDAGELHGVHRAIGVAIEALAAFDPEEKRVAKAVLDSLILKHQARKWASAS
jgi:hypothetical protein